VDDLPPGWHLLHAEDLSSGGGYLFTHEAQAAVLLSFRDGKPWDDLRRRVTNMVFLRWEAPEYYFSLPEGMVAIDLAGVDEAYIKVDFTDACAHGVQLRLRKGLYEVILTSYNKDLQDMCIAAGPAVDAELAFVTDLATKIVSRIP